MGERALPRRIVDTRRQAVGAERVAHQRGKRRKLDGLRLLRRLVEDRAPITSESLEEERFPDAPAPVDEHHLSGGSVGRPIENRKLSTAPDETPGIHRGADRVA